MTRRRTIVGELVLQPPANLTGARVLVTLRDTTLADAAFSTIAESGFDISGTPVARVPFRLDVPADLPTDRLYTVGAEIRRHAGDDVAPGDYLNMQSVPWAVDAAGPVVVPVRPIGGPTTSSLISA